MALSNEQLLKLYEWVVFARVCEDKLTEAFSKGWIPTFVHSGKGEEANAAAAIFALRPDDYTVVPHRPQVSSYYFKGADLNKVMAETFCKKGICKGKGGIMHMADFEHGLMGALGMIGYNLPLAVGVALAVKMRGEDKVVLNIFGDGASGQGTFHESLNMASKWKLPIVFFCINNGFAISTRPADVFPVRIVDRAPAYGMPGVSIDGNDPVAIYEATKKAVDRARKGEGPSLIESVCYRWRDHAEGLEVTLADRPYRTSEEVEKEQKKDPVLHFQKELVAKGILTQAKVDEVAKRVSQQIDKAMEFARKSPLPAEEEALEDTFGTFY